MIKKLFKRGVKICENFFKWINVLQLILLFKIQFEYSVEETFFYNIFTYRMTHIYLIQRKYNSRMPCRIFNCEIIDRRNMIDFFKSLAIIV